jgi:2-octaprenyl-6-methoxyphenol hydroxylase
MGMINRLAPIRDRLREEARGATGDLPLLLRGLAI